MHMGVFIDLSGQRFGRLVAVSVVPTIRPIRWQCRCDCGARCTARALLLQNGKTKSCGCLRREVTAALKYSHGMGAVRNRTPEYKTWLQIKQRCTNPKSPSFENYGQRGIRVCERWMASFVAFYEDMGPRPKATRTREYSIERIDNDGHYAPDNCRWATYETQSRNRRNNRKIELLGKAFTVQDWETITGLQVRQRLNSGWSVERALTEPAHHHNGRH